MTTRVFVGADEVAAIPPDDRGFAYGDGLFETMRIHSGRVPWWDAHWARLSRGARHLAIALPPAERVREEVEAASRSAGTGVLKLVVSRGAGGRGYAPQAAPTPTWTLGVHPLPASLPVEGIAVRWCDTRLATQPALSGLKHCNRLEQVLARAEWATATGAEAHDGLMRSIDGDVVCATAANVFLLTGGTWRTPALDRCGVAGVCREHVLRLVPADVGAVSVDDVESADAVVLCNAVRGILPVARLGLRTWAPHPAVRALQRQLAGLHPAFVVEES
jgi:4-amino-4-deoxychorismate lyase